ncbi:hypothetical protein VIGAN_08118700 [Vigna angularis var. angularis]|uniref:Uncharacterized protein n=1 Tax=Vigna angularis var. angularis TaxID=157739 RepID=A0A0S3SNY7_PHAAN|nr:hypothetical protein VIGAN_08118700 [Vigna angularis var. angularis]
MGRKRIVGGDNELGRKDEEVGFRGKRLQIFMFCRKGKLICFCELCYLHPYGTVYTLCHMLLIPLQYYLRLSRLVA